MTGVSPRAASFQSERRLGRLITGLEDSHRIAIGMFDEQRIALGVQDVEAVAYELQGLLVSDADVVGMSERLNGLAMTAVEDLLDGGDGSGKINALAGNFS
jgi:hypothetical protein